MMLKPYQEKAIRELLEESSKLLARSGNQKLIFKSPTGSGKTIMMAEFLRRLSRQELREYSYVWTAPRKLHAQSKEKLERYYEDTRALECSDFGDLNDRQIARDEILFLNWESINKKDKNTIVKENEQDFYLGKIVENTREDGRDIILIIDESHHHATSEISKQLIEDIAPKLTIEVSATPVLENPDEMVSVPLEDVKLQGMIKKSVILNQGFSNTLSGNNISSTLADGTDFMVLDEAIKKRNALARVYEEAGIGINPLLLIQLPDRRSESEDEFREDIVAELRDKYGISVQNGKLAIYLSAEKENLENITKNDSEAEVMIFKQAIALGWDCPRAQVLVLFRNWKSLTFSVQTVGRIMRMPEPEIGHYENDVLNRAYVYTNLSDVEIHEDMARGYIEIFTAKRAKGIAEITIPSVHRVRHREKTRLSPFFWDCFSNEAKKYDLAEKIDTKDQTVTLSLISDLEIESADAMARSGIQGTQKIDADSERDLQKLFDFFVRRNLAPFFPEERSVGRVKETLYWFFREELGMDYEKKFAEVVRTILSEKNQRHILNALDAAKSRYIEETQKRAPELARIPWSVPEMLNFTSAYAPVEMKKSAMIPFYSDKRWKTETAFAQFLDESESVEWWFKNGERDALFFAVPYTEHDEEKPFYVDFIVKMKDGRIGLFDTKGGQTVATARAKSDGLQVFLKQNKNMFGGIVANTDPRKLSGRWMLYTSHGESLEMNNFSNWSVVEM